MKEKKLEPKGKQATTPVAKGCAIVFVVLFVILIIIASIAKREENAKENASFERASSLLQDSKYEQALNELNSISSNYKKFNEVQILKQKADSLLSEESYELGKKLFDEKNYTEALGVLKKVSANGNHKEYNEAKNMVAFIENMENEKNYELGSKLLSEGKYKEAAVALKKVRENYKEYNEVKDMIAFINEMANLEVAMSKLKAYMSLDLSGKGFKTSLNNANNAASKNSIMATHVATFTGTAGIIESCEKYQNFEFKYLEAKTRNKLKADLKNLITQTKNSLRGEQRRDFPLIRREYAKIMEEAVWRNNIEVKATGSGNSRLEFTGGIFANNANIDDFQNKVLDSDTKAILRMYRFKRVAYRWSKYDNDYTYYQYDTPADDVISSELP